MGLDVRCWDDETVSIRSRCRAYGRTPPPRHHTHTYLNVPLVARALTVQDAIIANEKTHVHTAESVDGVGERLAAKPGEGAQIGAAGKQVSCRFFSAVEWLIYIKDSHSVLVFRHRLQAVSLEVVAGSQRRTMTIESG